MEIILSALAEAIMTVLIEDLAKQPRLAPLREALRGKSPEQVSLQRVLARTYLRFAQEYPELTASLFDENFLNKEIIQQELAKLLTPNQTPDVNAIAQKWQAQFNTVPKFDLAPPIDFFIDTLSIEIKSSPLLKPFVDSRAFEQLYVLAQTGQQQVQLQSEIKELLQEIRDNVARAKLLQNGIVVSPQIAISSGSAFKSTMNQSEEEFVQHWLQHAKDYDNTQFQHHFRVATILYGQTGLPNDLVIKENAERLAKQIALLSEPLVEQRDEQRLIMLEWGYEASKAIQDWKSMFDIVWTTAANLAGSKHKQSLKWINRLEKFIPKFPQIFEPEKVKLSIEEAIVYLEIWVDVLRAICTSDLYEAHKFMENVERRLEITPNSFLPYSNNILPYSEKEGLFDILRAHYSDMAVYESDHAFELRKQKRFEQALHHYHVAREYMLQASRYASHYPYGTQEARILINTAIVYELRDNDGDFNKLQDTLVEAHRVCESSAEDHDRVEALIMLTWGRAHHNRGRPKEDAPIQERFMTNIKWDYKARASFTIEKLNYAMEAAVSSNSEDLFAEIHRFLSLAYFDLEKKSEALRHIQISIELYSQENNLYFLDLARKQEKRIKRSQSFWGF